jgi:dTDP-glucose 4,6-dehydratase
LLKCGREVIGISRSDEVSLPFRPYGWSNSADGFSFFKSDLNHDLDNIMALVKERKPKFIVNFAAQSMVGQSWDYPEDWMMTNVVSTTKLFERLRHIDHLDRYVHITTPEVYGSTDGWVSEDTAFNPSTPYAVSRAAGDMSLLAYHNSYDIPMVMTRAANVYGSGQQLYRIIPRAIMTALTGGKLELHGGGLSVRSFIHVDDVSEGTLIAAQNGEVGSCYHISNDHEINIRSLVAMILNQLDANFDSSVIIVNERLGKDQSYLLNSDKLRKLGWKDRICLEDGLRETILWAKKHLDSLKMFPQSYIHKR